jgi:DNA-directed RNA polymerase subunit beta'
MDSRKQARAMPRKLQQNKIAFNTLQNPEQSNEDKRRGGRDDNQEIVRTFKFREPARDRKRVDVRRRARPKLMGITKASLSTRFVHLRRELRGDHVCIDGNRNQPGRLLARSEGERHDETLVPPAAGMEYYPQVKIAGENVMEEPVEVPFDVILGPKTQPAFSMSVERPSTGEQPLAE